MKYFVVSDIHSFYEPMMAALQKKGFDEDNADHMLVVCGDLFDRGPDTLKVLEYMERLKAKGKVVLVKGNHELLLEDLLKSGIIYEIDKRNGTAKTAVALSGLSTVWDFQTMGGASLAQRRLGTFIKDMVPYFETPHYIFVHAWIPTVLRASSSETYAKFPEYMRPTVPTWTPNWREYNSQVWELAMWENPWNNASKGLNKSGKTIVFGHWHTSYGRILGKDLKREDEYKFEKVENFGIYEMEKWGVIGIDGCTSGTGIVNVLVVED